MQEVTRDSLRMTEGTARHMLEYHSDLAVPNKVAGQISKAYRLLANAHNAMELRRMDRDIQRARAAKAVKENKR